MEKTVLDLLTSANVMLDFLFSHDALHSVDDDFQVAICKSLVEAVISFAEFYIILPRTEHVFNTPKYRIDS